MRGWAWWFAVVLVLVGIFAPLIANDAPLVARVDGSLRFPALAELIGDQPPGPHGKSWKQWWYDLEGRSDTADWAVMPFIPYGPMEVDYERISKGPEFPHYLGNDDTGHDLLTLLLWGAGTAAWVAIGSVLVAGCIGVTLGAWAGYRGGWADVLVQRLIEIFLCFPALFLVLAVGAFLGRSVLAMVVVLGLVYWTGFARIVRGEFLTLREREFVASARGLGVGTWRLILAHLLPAARGPILVNAAFVAGSAIVVESTLAFLGVGTGLSTVSWGDLLNQGRQWAHMGAWHLWLFPGLALVLTVMSLHSLADRLQQQD